MLVSVIIPCYNAENYISECLNSALEQTYTETEIICVDDGSKDNTVKILKEYEQKYPGKIKVIKQENKGAPSARNNGFSMAKGDYVQFLDADDLLRPEKISHQVGLVKQATTKPDVVAGYCIWKKLDGTESTHYFAFEPWKDLVLHSLGDTCSNLWNSRSLKKINGWNEELKSSQEADLLLRLLKNNATILYDPVANTIVRQMTLRSVSTYNRAENLLRYLHVRAEILNYLKETNKLSADLEQTILKQLFFGLRELIHLNIPAAMNLFEKYIPARYAWSNKGGLNLAHKCLYFMLGFKRTELLIFKFLKNK